MTLEKDKMRKREGNMKNSELADACIALYPGNQTLAKAGDCGKVLVASQLDGDGNKSRVSVLHFYLISSLLLHLA